MFGDVRWRSAMFGGVRWCSILFGEVSVDGEGCDVDVLGDWSEGCVALPELVRAKDAAGSPG